LMELPDKYKGALLEELKKPKSRQQLSEDFFIEMEKALKTISRSMPGVIGDFNTARDALLKKYKADVIDNIVDFRKVAKIARATSVGANATQAANAIQRLLTDETYSITQAWNDTVSEAYTERDIVSRIDYLLAKFDEVQAESIDDEVRDKLEELIERTRGLLGTGE